MRCAGNPGRGSGRVDRSWLWEGKGLDFLGRREPPLPGWGGSLRESGYMYMYGWVPLLSTWNYHNIVTWLYPSTKLKKEGTTCGLIQGVTRPRVCVSQDPMEGSLEKTLMLGKIEGRRRGNRGWGGWIAPLTQWTWVWTNSGGVSEGRGGLVCCMRSMRSQKLGHDWVTEHQ